MIWKQQWNLEKLNAIHKNTMQEFLGIEFLEVGDDFIKARMPVNERTKQPMGLLHGGASVALAESLGSIASVMMLEDLTKQSVVGLEINANHIRAAREGFVTGITKAVHIGRTTQVWEIKIYNEEDKLTCISRITNVVLQHSGKLPDAIAQK